MRVRLFVEIDLDDEVLRRGTVQPSPPMLLSERRLDDDNVLRAEVPNSLARVVNTFVAQLPAVKESKTIIVPVTMTRDELL